MGSLLKAGRGQATSSVVDKEPDQIPRMGGGGAGGLGISQSWLSRILAKTGLCQPGEDGARGSEFLSVLFFEYSAGLNPSEEQMSSKNVI